MAKAANVRWTREHFLIALNLYRKLPFGKLHKGNPLIVEVAAKMGRSAGSLAMKLCNFAALDPLLKARGVRGLPGVTQLDRKMWIEFEADLATLGPESEQLLHDLFTNDSNREVDFLERDRVRIEPGVRLVITPVAPTESIATVKVRRGQQFFRQSILNAYGVRCCVTGINVPRMLVASHIKPWSDFPNDRLNARNGLCLSVIHDAAFDAGLMTLDPAFRLVLSKRLRKFFPQPYLEQSFVPFEGQPIRMPEMIAEPGGDFLKYHREQVFQG